MQVRLTCRSCCLLGISSYWHVSAIVIRLNEAGQKDGLVFGKEDKHLSSMHTMLLSLKRLLVLNHLIRLRAFQIGEGTCFHRTGTLQIFKKWKDRTQSSRKHGFPGSEYSIPDPTAQAVGLASPSGPSSRGKTRVLTPVLEKWHRIDGLCSAQESAEEPWPSIRGGTG